MVLQERCPHQDVRDLGLLRHIRGVGLSRPDGAKPATVLINGAGSNARRRLVADRVEYVLEPRGQLFNGLNDVGIAIVESVRRTEPLDEVEVARAAGRDDLEPVQCCDLDSVQADASCNEFQL